MESKLSNPPLRSIVLSPSSSKLPSSSAIFVMGVEFNFAIESIRIASWSAPSETHATISKSPILIINNDPSCICIVTRFNVGKSKLLTTFEERSNSDLIVDAIFSIFPGNSPFE